MLQALAIVALCILAAVSYGIVHDQITARICLEYFTIGHPPLFTVPVQSPTIIGLAWGVVATWWVGLALGLALAVAARAGRRQPRDVRWLLRPVAIVIGVTACLAVVSGTLGYLAASCGWVHLLEPLASRVPAQQHNAFLANLWAHSASYLFGTMGGVLLVARTWRSRKPVANSLSRGVS